MEQSHLIEAARGGGEAAFRQLTAPLQRQVRGYVLRLVTYPDDADDILQDTLLKAHKGLAGYRGEASFKNWLFSIASRECIEHLRKRKRWRRETQIDTQAASYESAELVAQSTAVHARQDFVFSIREHIAFCFSCIARVLPADEHAALMLREVYEFKNREASKMLGLSESVFRHKLAAGRKAMIAAFSDLCALLGKQGMCHQCAEIRARTAPEKRGEPVDDVSLAVADPTEALQKRLEIVRQADLADGTSSAWHDLLFRFMSQVEEGYTHTPRRRIPAMA